jgi:arsenate reductase-like glutaredoxin family protein
MLNEIISHTMRVPSLDASNGNASTVTRQLDVALMDLGWKLSAELMNHLSEKDPSQVRNYAVKIIDAAKELVGVRNHNIYFKEFPQNVPSTEEFWLNLIVNQLSSGGEVSLNLLDYPDYGRYLHSYEEMMAHQEEFMPLLARSAKILHLGKSMAEETEALYLRLAGSSVPLNENDRKLLQTLAASFLDAPTPNFLMRENKALVNKVRFVNGKDIAVNTPTDILRLACALSDGDVTLTNPTKFRSFPRKTRKCLLNALARLANYDLDQSTEDMMRELETWKRLAEKLHPFENKDYALRMLFKDVINSRPFITTSSRVEFGYNNKEYFGVLAELNTNPGMLLRNLDRMVRTMPATNHENLLKGVAAASSSVSGRVLISAIEALQAGVNRGSKRVFVNTAGKLWLQDETRQNLDANLTNKLLDILKLQLRVRFHKAGIHRLEFDSDAAKVALPLSEKNKAKGFGILPVGSKIPLHGTNLRFFMYWKQCKSRTDYDLSAMFLKDDFSMGAHCSWTNLADKTYRHSGDIVDAPNGASEFIDMDIKDVKYPYIVAQVNRFAGEDFTTVEENIFGFMDRDKLEKGAPFEAKTVKVKSEVRGAGRVAVPALFQRDSDKGY